MDKSSNRLTVDRVMKIIDGAMEVIPKIVSVVELAGSSFSKFVDAYDDWDERRFYDRRDRRRSRRRS